MNSIRNQYQDSTPSVYFNFDYSNQVTLIFKSENKLKWI